MHVDGARPPLGAVPPRGMLLPPGSESVLSSCSPGMSGVPGSGFGNLDLVRRGEPAHLWKCVCVPPVDLTSFVTHFEWDMAKYPAKQPLVGVVDTLAKVREGPALGGRSRSRGRGHRLPAVHGHGVWALEAGFSPCRPPFPSASCRPCLGPSGVLRHGLPGPGRGRRPLGVRAALETGKATTWLLSTSPSPVLRPGGCVSQGSPWTDGLSEPPGSDPTSRALRLFSFQKLLMEGHPPSPPPAHS